MTFEEKLQKLEDVTNAVKNPEISLEDALKAFEDGIKTARELEKEIDKIEGKVQILMNAPDFDDSENSADKTAENAEDEENEEKSTKKKRGKAKKAAHEPPSAAPQDDANTIYDTSSLEFALFDSPELND